MKLLIHLIASSGVYVYLHSVLFLFFFIFVLQVWPVDASPHGHPMAASNPISDEELKQGELKQGELKTEDVEETVLY